MTARVWVVGVGMTPFGVHPNLDAYVLARRALTDALADSGPKAGTSSIDAVFFATASHGFLHGQSMIAGQIAMRGMGIQGVPVYNVENACASGSSALALAATQIRAGEADVVAAVGVEKMQIGDPARSMALFDGAYDVSDPGSLRRTLQELGGEVDVADVGHRSIFMDIYAATARNHMRIHGTTAEQIAAVASKNHGHAVHNERAHYRRAMSIEEVLAARPLAPPLTVPMCAPITDGAAAVVLCSDDGLRRLGAERPVELLACVVGTGTDRDVTTFEGHVSALAASRAYDRAGFSPGDVDVAEVHDATAFGEVLQSELLGLVEPGRGGPAALDGETTLGGRIPINTSGGLESKGHPIGASGLGQVYELTKQLRGDCGVRQVDGARVALAENGGGFHRGEEAVAVVTILKAG